LIFQPNKFDGRNGDALLEEFWQALNGQTIHERSLSQAVDDLRDTYQYKSMPLPAAIRERISIFEVRRIDEERRMAGIDNPSNFQTIEQRRVSGLFLRELGKYITFRQGLSQEEKDKLKIEFVNMVDTELRPAYKEAGYGDSVPF